jgi:hypothetical protein
MTDPIADMLTRLRNANHAYHDRVVMPHSKIKTHIAEILQQEGYIAGWSVEDGEKGKNLAVELKYGPNRERRSPASAGSPSRVCGLCQARKPSAGARRPRRRESSPLHRAADRQAGQPREA